MTAGQNLRGFVGQGMSGRRPKNFNYASSFPPGTWTFAAPRNGHYHFHAWSPGSCAATNSLGVAGASGAYSETSRYLLKGQTVAIVVGAGVFGIANTTLTFPDGTVVTMTAGSDVGGGLTGVPGSSSGADVNVAGSLAGVAGAGSGGAPVSGTNPGGGAPANLPYRGGAPGNNANQNGQSPGGGCGAATSVYGGAGLVLVFYAKP